MCQRNVEVANESWRERKKAYRKAISKERK